jgi:hypothetical protein
MAMPSGSSILESKANDVFDGAQVGYELFRSDSKSAGKNAGITESQKIVSRTGSAQ